MARVRDKRTVVERYPVNVASGRQYGPGAEILALDARHPPNQGLLERGQIVKVCKKKSEPKRASKTEEEK